MTHVGFVGTGNMGGAIINGLSGKKGITTMGFDLDKTKLNELADKAGLQKADSMEELVRNSEYLILCVKPQQMKKVLEQSAGLLNKKQCLVSIAAGIPVHSLKKWSNNTCPVVRVMPNTPALVGEGVFAVCLDDRALTTDQRDLICSIFKVQGQVNILEEKFFDAFTAVIGSGPAYVYYFMESLIESAVTLGFSRSQAVEMVTALFSGSVQLSKQSELSISQLREMVSSPGGSTLAGLNHFDRKGVRGSIIDAVKEAWKRNQELGS